MENKKRKWISWRNICLPVEEGGLGIRNLVEVQNSLLMKFAGKLIMGGSLWLDFFFQPNMCVIHTFLQLCPWGKELDFGKGSCD